MARPQVGTCAHRYRCDRAGCYDASPRLAPADAAEKRQRVTQLFSAGFAGFYCGLASLFMAAHRGISFDHLIDKIVLLEKILVPGRRGCVCAAFYGVL